MKISHRIDIAFVLGAVLGAMATLYVTAHGPAAYAVAFLAPGLPLAFMILDFFKIGFDTQHFGAIWVCSIILVNALCFAVVWFLVFKSRRPKESLIGRAIFLTPAVLIVALWTAWFVRTRAEVAATVEPPHPVAPTVPFSSPLMGRWEGTSHGSQGDVPVTVLVRPAPDGILDGRLYTNRQLTGSFENATFAGDSLQFSVLGFTYQGYRSGDSLTLQMHAAEDAGPPLKLHFAGADTARIAYWEEPDTAAVEPIEVSGEITDAGHETTPNR